MVLYNESENILARHGLMYLSNHQLFYLQHEHNMRKLLRNVGVAVDGLVQLDCNQGCPSGTASVFVSIELAPNNFHILDNDVVPLLLNQQGMACRCTIQNFEFLCHHV